ncbi:phostensin-like [Conger conger]|uniref:phostensin-like n=1 Tax=Conger conger TaxID=82655 RepID=UPI002A5ADCA3|nr:phostensin-like [Conger conger]
MSASLPEWKQQLLERKRREEEEKERREHEEEARLANMPAWKRGIIQRRRAKQDGGGGGEPKPPFRSKSSDCFVPPPRGEGRGPGAGPCRGVPKRSVSFSERPIDQEQGEGVGPEPQGRHSDSPVGGAWPDGEGEGPDRGFGAEPKKGGHRDPPTGGVEERERGRGSPSCVPKMEPEIQVPRVHFYGEEPTQGAGPGAGRPLTFRAKSLQEKIGESYSGRLERSSSRQRGRETLCTAAIAGSPGTRRRTVRRLHGTSVASCRGGQRAEPVGQGAEPESEGVAVATLQTSLELLHLREAGAGGRKWPPQLGQKAGGETQPPPQALRGPRALPAPSSQPQTPKPLTISPRTGPAEQGAPADPTPAATPPLFSLRSSGGAQGKRGNTITISPRRSPAGLGAVRAGAPTRTGCSITVTPRATAAPAPTPTPNGTAAEPGDGGKKRYPTAQEIQVIGGYQSLDRSCLAKQRRKHKEVKVCFDDTRLEQLCEYPSESAWLACFPCPTQPITEREGQARGVEDEEEEEEEEGGAFPSGNVRMARPAAGRMLRVDESCHR